MSAESYSLKGDFEIEITSIFLGFAAVMGIFCSLNWWNVLLFHCKSNADQYAPHSPFNSREGL